MKKNYLLVLGFFGVLLGKAQVSDLGSYVQVTDVSNTGVAVGHASGMAFFMWTETAGGSIIGEAGEMGVSGNANVSADGSVVSLSLANPSNQNLEEAVLYNVADQQLTFLGSLGVASGNDTSSAWGMSSDGKKIAGFAWNSGATGEAVLWKENSSIIPLGSTVSGANSRANNVNADGTVVVGWQEGENGGRLGVRWKNGVQEFLKDNQGNVLGEAYAVSADGKTICGVSNYTGLGYIWNETEGTTFITSDNPYYITEMTVISDDGNTALGFSFDPTIGLLFGEGFIWTKTGGKVNLNEYVNSLGYDDLDITFAVPTGISPDGKYIGGIGANFVQGDAKGFLIKLPGALATQNSKSRGKLTVYPNPVNDTALIKSSAKIESAEIYSSAGQMVLSTKNINNSKLDLSGLPKGIYIMKVTTDQGTQSVKLLKN